MTTVMGETDTDLTILFDSLEAVPCESLLGCDREATWSSRMKCCAHIFLWCDEHKEKHIEWIIGVLEDPKNIIGCMDCKTKWKHADIYIWERL